VDILRKMLSIGVIGISLFFVLSLLTGSDDLSKNIKKYDAQLRINDYLPIHYTEKSKKEFASVIGNSDSLDKIKMKVDLPTFTSDQIGTSLTEEQLKRVKIVLAGKNGGGPIEIHYNDSYLNTAITSSNKILLHGVITGTLKLNGQDTLVTVGVTSIPEDNQSHFSLMVSAYDDVEPLAIAFGNLEPSKEIIDIIIPK
jgi:hypothetical protein